MLQNEDGPQRTHSLESGDSQTLKVSPTRKVLNLISYGKGGASEKVGNVINLHFEGNWMPLQVRWLPCGPLYHLRGFFVMHHASLSYMLLYQQALTSVSK